MLNTTLQKVSAKNTFGISQYNNKQKQINTVTKPYDNDVFKNMNKPSNLTFKGSIFNFFHLNPEEKLIKELKKMHEHFNKMIEKDPKNSAPFFERSKIYAENGFFRNALQDISRAVELDPKNFFLHYNKGAIDLQLENHEDAVKDFTEAIRLNKGILPACYVGRADAYRGLGKHNLAIEDYTRALNVPEDKHKALFIIYNGRGQAYEALGRKMEAISDYNRAIDDNPKSADTYYNRSKSLIDTKYIKQAIEDAFKAIQLEPKNKKYIAHSRQITVGMMNSNKERLEFYDILIKKDGRNPDLYAEKALIHELVGDKEKAKECERMATLLTLTKPFLEI